MRWKRTQQLISLIVTLLVCTGSFAQQSVMPDHNFPEGWQRLYKENDYVRLIVLGEKRIWGDDPVAIVIDRWSQELLDKKMAAKACAFFSGKCISGTFIQRSDCGTEGSQCRRLGRWSFYYQNGKPMQVRLESGRPKSRSIPDDMPTSSEPISNEDAFEKAAREFSNYEQVTINHGFSILIYDNPKMTWDAMHYWTRGRPNFHQPSMFSEGCEPLSATVSLWKGEKLMWSHSFGRNYNQNIEPYGHVYRSCEAEYITSVVGEFLILGDSVFVTTGYANGFVLRFRIRDGYSGNRHDGLLVINADGVVKAKRALRAEYLQLMESDNIPGWEANPTRQDYWERKVVIDYVEQNKIETELLRRRSKGGDPLSTERISRELLNKLSIN